MIYHGGNANIYSYNGVPTSWLPAAALPADTARPDSRPTSQSTPQRVIRTHIVPSLTSEFLAPPLSPDVRTGQRASFLPVDSSPVRSDASLSTGPVSLVANLSIDARANRCRRICPHPRPQLWDSWRISRCTESPVFELSLSSILSVGEIS